MALYLPYLKRTAPIPGSFGSQHAATLPKLAAHRLEEARTEAVPRVLQSRKLK
jgi:hypothetical protein